MLESNNHDCAGVNFGRCELSKRQDWCLEGSADVIGVIDVIIKYTIKTRQLDANILRDSSLRSNVVCGI